MSTALSITDLSFAFDHYGKKLFFESLNLEFVQNDLHFIRGKNGAGKSTLFRLMRGKLYNDEYVQGTVTVNNRSFDLGDEERRDGLKNVIRMVPQKFDLMLADQFSFTQNLQLATIPEYPQLQTFVPNAPVPKLVGRFGIDFDTPVQNLSGGQRQILAILMALQKPTRILLLDEPTAALDDKNGGMVMRFLQELLATQKELTVLVICHDKELVDAYAGKQYYQIDITNSNTRTIQRIARPNKK